MVTRFVLPPVGSVPLAPKRRGAPGAEASMRGCAAVHARLHEFVDDELDPRNAEDTRVRRAIAAHLSGCTRCARLEAERRAMRAALAAVGARARRLVGHDPRPTARPPAPQRAHPAARFGSHVGDRRD